MLIYVMFLFLLLFVSAMLNLCCVLIFIVICE